MSDDTKNKENTKENANKKHILVVEDEKPMAKALTLKLEDAGFSVATAGNGEEALAAIKEAAPDFVLLDIVMPETDGHAFLKKLREQDNDVPVAITSNLSQEEDKEKMEELGIETYFVKSDVSLADIVDYVREHFGA